MWGLATLDAYVNQKKCFPVSCYPYASQKENGIEAQAAGDRRMCNESGTRTCYLLYPGVDPFFLQNFKAQIMLSLLHSKYKKYTSHQYSLHDFCEQCGLVPRNKMSFA